MKSNANEITFTYDNLKKAINKLNKLLSSQKEIDSNTLSSKNTENNKNNKDNSNVEEQKTKVQAKDDKAEKLKKVITFINKFSESLKDSKNEDAVLEYLLFLAENLSESVYAQQGDEIMEDLWKLYKVNTDQLKFDPYSILYKLNPLSNKNLPNFEIKSNPEYFLNLLFMNENLTENILESEIVTFDKDRNVIKFDIEVSKTVELVKNQYEKLSNASKINNILDLIFIKIMCLGDMKTFYTVLSSMLMLTEGKTILIFKLISYFALCLFTFKNKESFVGSLLFILGGMLRDYAKSYMKTKGLERIIFSGHKCAHQVNLYGL